MHGMIVHAHARELADQKAVVRAGADVLVHMVQNQPLDDEFRALLREKRPYWGTVISLSLGELTAVCDPDPFFEQALPPKVIAQIRATTERKLLAPSCGPPPPNAREREERRRATFRKTSPPVCGWCSVPIPVSNRDTHSDQASTWRSRAGCSSACLPPRRSSRRRHGRRN